MKGKKLVARLHQVRRWLASEFPTPFPVTLRVVGDRELKDLYGDCYRDGKKIHVRVSKELALHDAVDTLLHEWAHAMTVKHESLERVRESHHDDEWGLAFAKVYRGFHDEGGRDDSREL